MEKESAKMPDVVVTRNMIGIYAMQVCAIKGASDEDILRVCNTMNPAGTTNGWSTVFRKIDEHHGENMLPIPCKDYPNREHLIIFC